MMKITLKTKIILHRLYRILMLFGVMLLAWRLKLGLVILLGPAYLGLSSVKIPVSTERVVDGDTVIVRVLESSSSFLLAERFHRGQLLNVRLAHIDAPENDQKSWEGQEIGHLSSAFLKSLLQEYELQLEILGRDYYGRILGRLYTGKNFINLEMVKKGMALVYPSTGFNFTWEKGPFFQAYFLAFIQRRGLWATGGFDSPSEFRKAKKKKARAISRPSSDTWKRP